MESKHKIHQICYVLEDSRNGIISAKSAGRTAYFLDPEQNAWEVAWNPTAVFDERGAMVTF